MSKKELLEEITKIKEINAEIDKFMNQNKYIYSYDISNFINEINILKNILI